MSRIQRGSLPSKGRGFDSKLWSKPCRELYASSYCSRKPNQKVEFQVKDNWNELTKFFDTILILVETNLKGNIDTFLLEAKVQHSTIINSPIKEICEAFE